MATKRGRNWKREAGLAVLMITTIMMCLPVYVAFANPRLIFEYWDVYLPFVLLPYGLGLALWVLGGRTEG